MDERVARRPTARLSIIRNGGREALSVLLGIAAHVRF